MNRYLIPAAIFILLSSLSVDARGQYWGEAVLEKSFEREDFFFTPGYLNPYGIGSFQNSAPGLLRNPLLELMINPARVKLDSTQDAYFYTDFRSARQIHQETPPYYGPWVAYDMRATSSFVPYPHYFVSQRRELEPVFSGAAIGRMIPMDGHEFTVGMTYQYLLQDDKYYNIPQDIYRSTIGYDYNGTRAAGAENMPVIDKYSGEDNIHQGGHFLSAFAQYALPVNLDLGFRASRVQFDRTGGVGSSNYWEHSPQASSTSLWSNFERRNQEYAHWDLGGGIRYHFSEEAAIGVSGGMLWGEATQSMHIGDSSYYMYSSTPSKSYYNRSGNTFQEWLHEGKTPYFGVDLSAHISERVMFNLFYQYQRSDIDLTLASSILDTSYSTYSWENNGTPVTNYSQSYLRDTRTGSGEAIETMDRVKASIQWTINEQVSLSIGAQMEWRNSETNTSETVALLNRSAYWGTQGMWDYRYGENTSKDLLWTFSSKRSSFQIPVFLTIRASSVLEVLLGLNRNMAQWEINEVTLAAFRYREIMRDGVKQRDENFGERYTTPTEKVSDIQTSFLAGLKISPAELLHIQLLVVPVFRDSFEGSQLEQFQWWIGLSLNP